MPSPKPSSSPTTTTTSLALSLSIFTLPILLLQIHKHYNKTKQQHQNTQQSQNNNNNLALLSQRRNSLQPPLPPIVQKLLSKCHLAYLSTVDTTSQSSHLSLMRFTYLKEEEVIIMSTNVKTKKFEMLQKQRGVALLVHDFGAGDDDDGDEGGSSGEFSITLNGTCSIVDGEEKAERYRAAHLNHNPDYPQFIVGDDIAILCINVSSARICNINDQVLKWNVERPQTLAS